MTIWETLQKALERFPDKTAVVEGDLEVTYAQVAGRIRSLANYLRRQGIGRGDRVSILDVNSLAFFEAYYAAAGLGAILNPINYRLSVRELTFILDDAGSRWLLASSRFSSQVSELLDGKTPLEGTLWLDKKPEIETTIEQAEYGDALSEADTFSPVDVGFEAPAHLYYTSGTTGKSKGVVLTHYNVCRHAEAAVEELEIDATDVWGHIAPMFHLADAWAVFAVTSAGGRHLILPTFDAAAALELIEAEKMTISNLIPTMLNLMVSRPDIHEYDLSSLRVILSGGAPIAPEVVLKIVENFRCDYVQTYGMTETSPYLALSVLNPNLKQLPADRQLAYKARTGRPFKTIEMRVMRDDGQHEVEANDEEVGEIWVRGETVMPGYWNLPEETLEAFTDGWFRTGDLAVVDLEGYVNIVDRKKDMIISGGENIYSIEVESVLNEHPDVLEAAVIGVPDDIWGEMVHAYVVLKSGASADEVELLEFCREKLTTFKVPQSIEFLTELPKTGSGRIFKKALKEQYEKR